MPPRRKEKFDAGAQLVQIYTGLVYRGPQLIREIACLNLSTNLNSSPATKCPTGNRFTLTLGHSPDPDDAFMFYAMAENKIDLRGYRFHTAWQDIQTLNERATRGELHISAISIHALAYVWDKYALLPCGASMGDGYGPLFVAAGTRGTSRRGGRGPARKTGFSEKRSPFPAR